MTHPGARLRMFFGHQSVGADIVQGVGEIDDEPTPHITEGLPDQPTVASWLLAHRKIGRNQAPATKIADVEALLDNGNLRHFDVLMLKFCYVDVRTRADADGVFESYSRFVARSRQDHPELRIAHCTMPLRRLPSGPYAVLRRLLGHRHPEIEANRAREHFNQRLRDEFVGEPIFDLARIESTKTSTAEGPPYGAKTPSLLSEYTDDGGHLNTRGRAVAGRAFLEFMHSLEYR